MEGPLRFQCPPEFEAVAGGVPLGGGPCTELWLIRAPADFCPQSLEGCLVPLNGLERLQTPPGGDNDPHPKLYILRGGPGGGDCPLLLSPVPTEGSLSCAPPLRGSLTITQSFGTPPGTPPRKRRKKKEKVTAELVAPGDTGTEPGEGLGPPQVAQEELGPPQVAQEELGPPQVAQEGLEVAKKKKKKEKVTAELVTRGDTGTEPGEGLGPPQEPPQVAQEELRPPQVAQEELEVAKKKKKKKKEVTPELVAPGDTGTWQGTEPGEGPGPPPGPPQGPPQVAQEEPEVAKRKKKKKKHKREEEE